MKNRRQINTQRLTHTTNNFSDRLSKIITTFATSTDISHMTIDDIRKIIAPDEHRELELKKTTGELKEAMHSACAFLNTDGGWLIFGIAPIQQESR